MRPGRDGALWDCFRGSILNMTANLFPKGGPTMHLTSISTRSPAPPQSDEYLSLSQPYFQSLSPGRERGMKRDSGNYEVVVFPP